MVSWDTSKGQAPSAVHQKLQTAFHVLSYACHNLWLLNEGANAARLKRIKAEIKGQDVLL